MLERGARRKFFKAPLREKFIMVDDLERVQIDTKKSLWEWLSIKHDSDKSYLLVTWKKSNKDKYVSRDEVLDALLAYGWIVGRRCALDEHQTMQLVCKRKQQTSLQCWQLVAFLQQNCQMVITQMCG